MNQNSREMDDSLPYVIPFETRYDNTSKLYIQAYVRFDDHCRNGHGREMAVTGEGRYQGIIKACGCMHEEISRTHPELREAIRFHLVSQRAGPVHYIENAAYWLGWRGWCDGKPNSPPNFDNFLSAACIGALPEDSETDWHKFLQLPPRESELIALLQIRLPKLVARMNEVAKNLGFVWKEGGTQ